VDNYGNIMHEVQDGDTLGDIAFLYGYTWDDIDAMLALNDMTEADIRVLEVGSVFLVPPQSGTYTPTAAPQGATTAEATDPASEPSRTLAADTNAESGGDLGILSESDDDPDATPDLAETDIVRDASVTPSPTPTRAATRVSLVATEIPPSTQAAPLPTLVDEPTIAPDPVPARSGAPLWLIAAIVVQVGILGVASFEYWRRSQ
jgi:hypothetical protein